jgi:hypothetical protein
VMLLAFQLVVPFHHPKSWDMLIAVSGGGICVGWNHHRMDNKIPKHQRFGSGWLIKKNSPEQIWTFGDVSRKCSGESIIHIIIWPDDKI